MGIGSSLSLSTPRSASHSTRLLESSRRTAFSTMEALFSHLNLLIRLDDMLGYAEDADTLIATLKSVLTICSEKGLKLNPRKCDLMATKVHFLGRMIDAKGVTFHPRHYEALTSMEGGAREFLHHLSSMTWAKRPLRIAEQSRGQSHALSISAISQ